LLRGDLDWIVMKALEKDRSRRYETANALANDIQRHLKSEPVEATPPNLVYLIRKMLRRRRKEVTVAALLLAALACAAAIGLQINQANDWRRNFDLSQLRREESVSLNRVIGGLALTEPERNLATACITRLASRVKAGLGSQTDHELLARFLAREVRLSGRLIQTIDQPLIDLCANTGRGYPVNGVGVILRPLVALDGIDQKVGRYPAYISGGSSGNVSTGVRGDVSVKNATSVTGIRSVSCILEAQLVHAKGTTSVQTMVQPGDYQTIGTPVRIVFPASTRLFLRQLPKDYPLEVVDSSAVREISDGLTLSQCRVAVDRVRGTTVDLEIIVPLLSPPLPLALQLDLVQLGRTPLRAWVCGIIFDENDSTVTVDGDDAKSPSSSIDSKSQTNCKYHLKFLLPEIKSLQLAGQPASAQIIVHSSQKVALRSDVLERFLSVPEIRKSVTISVE
jgi:hypothetical protein